MTDLRELDSSAVAIADMQALRLFSDLMIPWHAEAAKRLRQSLKEQWPPRTFVALGQVAFLIADLLRVKDREAGASFGAEFPPSAMVYAGRAILGGKTGLSAALWEIGDQRYKWWGRGASPWDLSPRARTLIGGASAPNVPGAAHIFTYQRDKRGDSGPASQIPRRPDILWRTRHSETPVRGHRVLPVLREAKGNASDAQDIDRVCDILGIGPADVESLLLSGELRSPTSRELSVLPHQKFVSASSLRDFMRKIVPSWDSEPTHLRWTLTSIRDFNKRAKPFFMSDIMRALAHSDIPRFCVRSEVSSCWLDTTCVVSPADLVRTIERVHSSYRERHQCQLPDVRATN